MFNRMATGHTVSMGNHLLLDQQTLDDLEVFEASGDGASLFDLINLTRTSGGAKALRNRMANPWCDAGRITSTQQSISFVLDHPLTFDSLPSSYVTSRTEHYLNESLPLVTEQGKLEFSLGALALWINGGSHYLSILRGVQVASRLVQSVDRFVVQFDDLSPVGELLLVIEELRSLLMSPGMALARVRDPGRGPFRVLRFDQAFRLFGKSSLERMLQLLYEVDALVAMAEATRKHGFVLPEVEEGALRVSGQGLVHPLIKDPVSNPLHLDQHGRLLFLTGPNMAGKTTYLRSIATALFFGHLGMGVPAIQFSFSPAQRLFSAISLSDDLQGGISYFRAEALRVKAIAHAVAEGQRVIAVMDEPFKGTNVKDALDASLAILERLAAKRDCLFMVSSHLIELADQLMHIDQISARYFDAGVEGDRLKFDYSVREGISSQRLGMRVLQEEGIFELLE
jgi:DNA mismatch repair ATPase MutS